MRLGESGTASEHFSMFGGAVYLLNVSFSSHNRTWVGLVPLQHYVPTKLLEQRHLAGEQILSLPGYHTEGKT